MNYYHIIFGENVPFNILDYKSVMFNNDFYNSIKHESCETTNDNPTNDNPTNDNATNDNPTNDNPTNDNVIKENNVNTTSNNINSYTPDKKESLFWCIYIAINGFVEYELISRNFTNVIITEKQKVAESFSQNIKRMKNINIKLTNGNIQNIISDMMTNQPMNIEMLYGFAIYYKRQILVVYSNVYIDILPDICEDDPIVISKKTDYSLEFEPCMDDIKYKYYLINTPEKPLKGVSTYKIQELRDIGELFNIDISKKMDKNTLYNEISYKIKMEIC